MCFAWHVRTGDCLDLEALHKVPCSANVATDTVKVTDVKIGSGDGAECPDPNRWLQAGSGDERGIACFMPTSMENRAPSGDATTPTPQ